METLLNQHQRRDMRLEELILLANQLLPVFAPEQSHGKTSDRLDERTVRYYIGEGLVDRPLGQAGASGLYGYRHLLQLLAIKRLQAQGLPLRSIRSVTPERPNAELERLLESAVSESPARKRETLLAAEGSAVDYLLGLLPEGRGRRSPEPPARAPGKGRPHLSAPMSPAFSPAHPALEVSAPPAPAEQGSRDWTRVTLEDGLELQVAADFHLPSSSAELQRLADHIVNALGRVARRRSGAARKGDKE